MHAPTTTAVVIDPSLQASMMRLLRPLLEQLLVRASRFQETPLQFEMDSAGVAMAAWSSFSADLSAADKHLLSSGLLICEALDLLVAQALGDPNSVVVNDHDLQDFAPPARGAGRDTQSVRGAALDSPLVRIAEWFDKLCDSLRAAHPTAIEALRLRVEGYGPRDIGVRMGTGERLVRRLLADVRGELKQAKRHG